MRTSAFLLCTTMLLSLSANAATIALDRAVNVPQLLEELEAGTGMRFSRDCPDLRCTVQGHINAFPGRIEVVVYEALNADAPWIQPVKLNDGIRDKISAILKNHRPNPLEKQAAGASDAEMVGLMGKLEKRTISADEKDRLLLLMAERMLRRPKAAN